MDKSLNSCKVTIEAFIIIKKNINTKSVNKQYLLIKEEVNVARKVGKPKRQEIPWFWYQCLLQ